MLGRLVRSTDTSSGTSSASVEVGLGSGSAGESWITEGRDSLVIGLKMDTRRWLSILLQRAEPIENERAGECERFRDFPSGECSTDSIRSDAAKWQYL